MQLTWRLAAILLLLALVPTGALEARPKYVILIRHGEKPPPLANGNESSPELSLQGKDRANKLVDYFLKTPWIREMGPIAAIYAQMPKQRKSNTDFADASSRRPIETVQPLATRLNLPITGTTRDDYKDLIEGFMADPALDGKTVLISWEHDAIVGIVETMTKGLGCTRVEPAKTPGGTGWVKLAKPCPARGNWQWPIGRFDRTWVIMFGRQDFSFYDAPQNVLPGDQTK